MVKRKITGPGYMFLDGVPVQTIELLEAATVAIYEIVEFKHFVQVVVCPSPVVTDGRTCGFGAFNRSRTRPEIWMGGDYSSIVEQGMMEQSEVGCCLISTLLHELAHYEQARDGRKVQERGVAIRTRSLCRAFLSRLQFHFGSSVALQLVDRPPKSLLPHFDPEMFLQEIEQPKKFEDLVQKGFKQHDKLTVEAAKLKDPDRGKLIMDFVLDKSTGEDDAPSLHVAGGVSEADRGAAGSHADHSA